MRASCVVFLGLILVPLALSSCGDSSDGGNTNVNDNSDEPVAETGTITGVVSLLAQEARSSVAEMEPNDTFEQAISTLTVGAGSRLEIFGELSTADGDLSDAFLFQVESTAGLRMQAILSFDFNPDIATSRSWAKTLRPVTVRPSPSGSATPKCVAASRFRSRRRRPTSTRNVLGSGTRFTPMQPSRPAPGCLASSCTARPRLRWPFRRSSIANSMAMRDASGQSPGGWARWYPCRRL